VPPVFRAGCYGTRSALATVSRRKRMDRPAPASRPCGERDRCT
jgi:hypothetical protein